MNTEHVNEWLHWMRTTDQAQGKGMLHVIGSDGTPRFCCLGGGCKVAGIPSLTRAVAELTTDENLDPFDNRVQYEETVVYYAGTAGPTGGDSEIFDGRVFWADLQPFEFNDWLGLPHGTLRLDVTIAMLTGVGTTPSSAAASRMYLHFLNDEGFTFSQIADLIERFGLTVDSEMYRFDTSAALDFPAPPIFIEAPVKS